MYVFGIDLLGWLIVYVFGALIFFTIVFVKLDEARDPIQDGNVKILARLLLTTPIWPISSIIACVYLCSTRGRRKLIRLIRLALHGEDPHGRP